MKIKTIIAAAALASIPAVALAEINLNLSPDLKVSEVDVYALPMDSLLSNSRMRPEQLANVKVTGNRAVVATSVPGAAYYVISLGDNQQPVQVFCEPDDKITVDVTNPAEIKVAGSAVMDDYTRLQSQLAPVMAEFQSLSAAGKATPEAVAALQKRYRDTALKFVNENPASPAVPLALNEIEGEDFLAAVDALPAVAKSGPYYPLVASKISAVKAQVEADRKRAEMASGNVAAPGFTLDGLDGKPVSLSDFRGKWVILDFWGSWCKWCIKGFPELKEAYNKYKDRLEVIGIDNRESVDDWKAGVKRYELPWVNVYNPQDDPAGIIAAYAVQGFPTKVIITPEGKIADITVGEDPSFFTKLDSLMGK